MQNFLKWGYRSILKVLPTRAALYIIFFKGYKKILNLKNPKYYGEKIQWVKLYGHLEELSEYVDKYEVRRYIEKNIGDKYLFKIYGVYDRIEDIDFSKLPNQFVLKCTNGSQSVLICKDKESFDIELAKKTMKVWLKQEFYRMKKEVQYKNIKNRILIEEYMEDESGELRDFKFYCFNGRPLWYSIFTGRFSDKTVDTFTIDGEFLEDCKNGSLKTKTSKEPLSINDKLPEFINIAQKLSEPFTFVRVDFYLVNGRIYFGELTFTDGAGSEPIFPIEKYDVMFAKEIPLKKVLKEDNA